MPKSCCVVGCTNNIKKNQELKFYSLPRDEILRRKWLNVINRAADNSACRKQWSPESSNVYVCSAHFITGKRELFEKHPDSIPSIFDTEKLSSPQRKINNNRINRVNRRISRQNLVVPVCKKLKLFDKSNREKVDFVIEKKSLCSKEINDSAYTESILEQCSSKSFEKQEFYPSESNKEQLEQCSSISLSNSTCNEDLLKQSSSKSFSEEFWFSTPNEETSVLNDTDCQLKQNSTESFFNLYSDIDGIRPVTTSERQQLYSEINNLRLERDLFMSKFMSLKFDNCNLGINKIRSQPDKCTMVTGLSLPVLEKLLCFLCKGTDESLLKRLDSADQIVFCLVKLRHNINFDMLSFMFGFKKTTALNNFWKWIDIMYIKLKFLIKMQDRDHIYDTIPPVFKCKFPRLTSIIDCFEVFVESPSSLMARAQFYSQYKKNCTIKCLISCTPLGAINFISKCYGGRASDNQIVRESEFISSKYHMPGDQILADRGFTLQDDFAAGSCSLLINPAFTKGKAQLSASDVEKSRNISSVRIHIERVIGLLKNRYTILQGTLPLRTVKNISDEATSLTLSNCDKIVTVCAALTNLGEGIVYDKTHLLS
ncbi:uncharacterized protein LOC124811567 isoform X2 [Hydra vulgaris]|uniref:uncharacterized protein LOC124811567 isoform X2 n=1 Tax=Hydra vulgaris TaxID=6087 RepID=UPI001F5EC295|nr:uncharacterized protein LOC124811567 isoform X2 [Hydra vulgaris]